MSDRESGRVEQAETELFVGDTGTLPESARRVLVSLLRDSYISAEGNAEEWTHLSEHRAGVESILNDLFLELHVDARNAIAYCLPVAEAGGAFPKLKREHELSEPQSLLIIFLRQQYLSQASAGADNVWVDGRDMHEHLGRLFSDGVVNHAHSSKTINSAIEYMRTHHYIEAVKGSDDRYRVLPIVETAFPLEKVETILDAYKKAAGVRDDDAQGGADTQGRSGVEVQGGVQNGAVAQGGAVQDADVQGGADLKDGE